MQVLGIIMVGTGVLMSQLLVEHVLDTTADEENRMWVYASWANTSLFAELELDTHTDTHTHTLRHSWELRVTASWAYYRGFKALSIPSAPRCAQNYYGNAVKATYSVFEATFSGSWPLGTDSD